MTDQEKEQLNRLSSYGNMSREEALEFHRLLNIEATEIRLEQRRIAKTQILPVENI